MRPSAYDFSACVWISGGGGGVGATVQSGLKNDKTATSLGQGVVQWLGLCALTAKDQGSIPAQGTKIPEAKWHSHNIT